GLEGTVSPGADGEPARFEIVGTGYPSTGTRGWEYRYYGHLMRDWPNGIDQRPALVGSVIRVKPHDDAPAGYVAPFIAVKRSLPVQLAQLAARHALPASYGEAVRGPMRALREPRPPTLLATANEVIE